MTRGFGETALAVFIFPCREVCLLQDKVKPPIFLDGLCGNVPSREQLEGTLFIPLLQGSEGQCSRLGRNVMTAGQSVSTARVTSSEMR